MPTVQEQDQDFADPHPVRGQAPLPRARVHEYCGQDVYEEIGGLNSIVLILLVIGGSCKI